MIEKMKMLELLQPHQSRFEHFLLQMQLFEPTPHRKWLLYFRCQINSRFLSKYGDSSSKMSLSYLCLVLRRDDDKRKRKRNLPIPHCQGGCVSDLQTETGHHLPAAWIGSDAVGCKIPKDSWPDFPYCWKYQDSDLMNVINISLCMQYILQMSWVYFLVILPLHDFFFFFFK